MGAKKSKYVYIEADEGDGIYKRKRVLREDAELMGLLYDDDDLDFEMDPDLHLWDDD